MVRDIMDYSSHWFRQNIIINEPQLSIHNEHTYIIIKHIPVFICIYFLLVAVLSAANGQACIHTHVHVCIRVYMYIFLCAPMSLQIIAHNNFKNNVHLSLNFRKS